MILTIDTNICFECGSDKNIQQHHVVPKSVGGTQKLPLCINCHGKVHHKDLIKFQYLAKKGREKYVQNGGKLGRKDGSVESTDEFMSKPQNQEIKRLLEDGHSVRQIVKMIRLNSNTQPSTTTIIKVRKALGMIGRKSVVNINSTKWL
jgi:hypothetical protein